MAIGAAVDFHEMIGAKRKEARLRFLKNYWVDQLKGLPRVSFLQSNAPGMSCAIANISIEGKKPEEVSGELFSKYKIHTVGINWQNIHGVRITPNVYTSLKELDKLTLALKNIAQ
jgi:selenocysteine lyase/cysteine desulfurase